MDSPREEEEESIPYYLKNSYTQKQLQNTSPPFLIQDMLDDIPPSTTSKSLSSSYHEKLKEILEKRRKRLNWSSTNGSHTNHSNTSGNNSLNSTADLSSLADALGVISPTTTTIYPTTISTSTNNTSTNVQPKREAPKPPILPLLMEEPIIAPSLLDTMSPSASMMFHSSPSKLKEDKKKVILEERQKEEKKKITLLDKEMNTDPIIRVETKEVEIQTMEEPSESRILNQMASLKVVPSSPSFSSASTFPPSNISWKLPADRSSKFTAWQIFSKDSMNLLLYNRVSQDQSEKEESDMQQIFESSPLLQLRQQSLRFKPSNNLPITEEIPSIRHSLPSQQLPPQLNSSHSPIANHSLLLNHLQSLQEQGKQNIVTNWQEYLIKDDNISTETEQTQSQIIMLPKSIDWKKFITSADFLDYLKPYCNNNSIILHSFTNANWKNAIQSDDSFSKYLITDTLDENEIGLVEMGDFFVKFTNNKAKNMFFFVDVVSRILQWCETPSKRKSIKGSILLQEVQTIKVYELKDFKTIHSVFEKYLKKYNIQKLLVQGSVQSDAHMIQIQTASTTIELWTSKKREKLYLFLVALLKLL